MPSSSGLHQVDYPREDYQDQKNPVCGSGLMDSGGLELSDLPLFLR